MKGTLKKELRLQSGRSFTVGEVFEIIPPTRNHPTTSFIVLDIEKQLRIPTATLGKYFKEFDVITMRELEKGSFDSICKSMTGIDVEPDGWDEHGFPSMLLAMGMI